MHWPSCGQGAVSVSGVHAELPSVLLRWELVDMFGSCYIKHGPEPKHISKLRCSEDNTVDLRLRIAASEGPGHPRDIVDLKQLQHLPDEQLVLQGVKELELATQNAFS